jgi:alpha,alpha-trehalase
LVVFVGVSFAQEELLACSSKVYCNNEILSTVQLSGIFNDSKTFVDMPIKTSVAQVLDAFNNLPIPPSNADLMEFIEENFDAPGSDLLVWQPDDHKPDPSSLKRIVDSELYDWAIELNMLWIELGRRVSQDTIEHPENHSLMPVLNGFFVPGGRFREFYYWDTYWIINGLLACEMLPSTVGVLENFFHFVDSIGFIPNGARVYYTERSQPPMLTQMMKSYYHVQAQSNLDTANNFLERYISLLDQEHQFWMNNRSVNIQGFTLNRYQAHSNVPRPEGYAEDVETATEAGVSNPEGPNQIYVDLASGAESGWDFSSR